MKGIKKALMSLAFAACANFASAQTIIYETRSLKPEDQALYDTFSANKPKSTSTVSIFHEPQHPGSFVSLNIANYNPTPTSSYPSFERRVRDLKSEGFESRSQAGRYVANRALEWLTGETFFSEFNGEGFSGMGNNLYFGGDNPFKNYGTVKWNLGFDRVKASLPFTNDIIKIFADEAALRVDYKGNFELSFAKAIPRQGAFLLTATTTYDVKNIKVSIVYKTRPDLFMAFIANPFGVFNK